MDLSDFDPSGLLSMIPARYELYVALLIIFCKLVTVFVKPPASGSRWVGLYMFISLIGLNVGWAANHLKPGHGKPKLPG